MRASPHERQHDYVARRSRRDTATSLWITGRLLRTGLVVLAGALVGIMSPLALFFTDLFPGAPTLAAQYVLKNIVLGAAGLVVAATAMGAHLEPGRARRHDH
ncbi:MAG TPA: hypothetical protein VK923_04265 [Euzebyales bacterium]|nr:hypothetical protein [Euzebyales bacterium]